MDALGALLPILLIGAVFYLLIMRPARTRQKAQANLLTALEPGTSIMTTAGVFGTVTAVTDDNIMVEVAPGVELRMVKASVGRVLDEVVPSESLLSESLMNEPGMDELAGGQDQSGAADIGSASRDEGDDEPRRGLA